MREIDVWTGELEALEADLLALPLSNDAVRAGPPDGTAGRVDVWLGGALGRALEAGVLQGDEGQTRFLAVGTEGRPDVLVVGTGDSDPRMALRRAAGTAVRAARQHRARSVGLLLPRMEEQAASGLGQAAAEGLVLGDWSYDELRGEEARRERPPPPGRALLVAPGETSAIGQELREGAGRGRLLAEVQNQVRSLVAQPGNVATPRHLAAVAERWAEDSGFTVQAWGPEKLRREGFGALLAVARGSAEEPRFLILEHRGAEESPFVVVGKGVTFDSGGISLKPSSGMESMKYDMAGAAAVLGVLQAAARLGLPRRVVGLIPATENLPSGTALKPGDVIRGLSGTSIEVVNTDAEGRLILSDALTYALRLNPRAVVDVATLTGGCVVALGHHAIGMMAPQDGLAAALEEAGRRSGERVWRLPLWPEYRKQLDSAIADLKNTGGKEASPITAGWFLRSFIRETVWAHLDIAGTAWAEEAGGWQPKGATGVGVRLLVEWLREG